MEKIGRIQLNEETKEVPISTHLEKSNQISESKPIYVKIMIRYDESPRTLLTVNVNPLNWEKNIHRFISQLCQVLNYQYDPSLILLLEPDHIVFDVTTIEENDQLRIVSRTKLSAIMSKQEDLRRKGIYLKVLYSSDPLDCKTSPLDVMKDTSNHQKLGEEFIAKSESPTSSIKKEFGMDGDIMKSSSGIQKTNYYQNWYQKMNLF